jgi:phosphatidylethanolamine/phosphatidyl-N-methylethanolamine N-methyltransferase
MTEAAPFKRLRAPAERHLAFFQGFLRDPQQVGSVVPSSPFLERRLVRLGRVDRARLVVELGPGTGGTTEALLEAIGPGARLLAIEIDPGFVQRLRRLADPRLLVHGGSAEFIGETLRHHGLGAPDVVLSGIPFSTMPPDAGTRILREVWHCLAPGGCFVAYQFRDRVAVLGRRILGEPEMDLELLNVPPMRVYRWSKPA